MKTHLVGYAFLLLTWNSFAEQKLPRLLKTAAQTYADIAYQSYRDSLNEAEVLRDAVARFTQSPNPEQMELAKQAWVRSRVPYLQTEVFRFYGGPIDDEDGPEVFINGWPMDEAYVDYVLGIPEAGIINDPNSFPTINRELLLATNEKGGETMISCGYHAIEFLLWGQDFSVDGPGNRPVSDFTTQQNATRRASYINACCDLLVEQLASLVEEWSPGQEDNYRASFLATPAESLRNAVGGIRHFCGIELAGERLLVAWDTQAQEDEHSCFSDTTHLDFLYDTQGLINLYRGTYLGTNGTTISGTGLGQVAAALAPEAAIKLDELTILSAALAKKIPVPFDQAIQGEKESPARNLILKCVVSLEDQAVQWGILEQALIRLVR